MRGLFCGCTKPGNHGAWPRFAAETGRAGLLISPQRRRVRFKVWTESLYRLGT